MTDIPRLILHAGDNKVVQITSPGTPSNRDAMFWSGIGDHEPYEPFRCPGDSSCSLCMMAWDFVASFSCQLEHQHNGRSCIPRWIALGAE